MMDFLDPKQRRAHDIRLIVGYVLVAIALVLATTILFYQANGFGVKAGKVIQNGLVFVSSNPSPAQIYLNGQRYKDDSNTRMVLQSGTYTMRLSRDGYRDWQRALTVEGGGVEHFDYPLLIPKTLAPAKLADYSTSPLLYTQSPDRRWLMVQLPSVEASFEMFDLKDPKKVADMAAGKKADIKTVVNLPLGIFDVKQDGPQSLEVIEWSNDNDHVLLQHKSGDQSEYILASRKAPETSVNLTKQLQLNATTSLTLQDKKFDSYFMLDSASSALSTITLDNPKPVQLLTNVIQYKTYGDNTVLYASSNGAAADKTAIRLLQDGDDHLLRQVSKSDLYLLALTSYDGKWYMAAGVPAENHLYIYRDPVDMLKKNPDQTPVPASTLKITAPNYVAISDTSQMFMVENGQDFGVYDAEEDRTHIFHIDKPLDAPQTHATWMDGFRLRLVSGGQTVIFDYDGTNTQTLEPMAPNFMPLFDTGYQTLYSLSPAKNATAAGQTSLTATPLRIPKDQ